jgi:hypothetical protein
MKLLQALFEFIFGRRHRHLSYESTASMTNFELAREPPRFFDMANISHLCLHHAWVSETNSATYRHKIR